MPEKLKSYFVDPEGVYAKSLNSIYDEYWRNGKFGKYGVLTRISSAFSNVWLFIYTLAKTAYDLLNNIVNDIISFVVDFFKWPFNWGYSKLPLVPSFTIPGLEKSEWSYTVSPTHLTKYLPSTPNVGSLKDMLPCFLHKVVLLQMSYLKDSALGLVYNAEKCFYDFFTSLKTGGMLITNGLQRMVLALFDVIAYPFEKLSDGVPALSSWKTSAMAAGNTAEEYLYSGLTTLTNVGRTIANNIVDWLRLVWQGVSVLFLLITSPFQRHHVTVIDQKPDEVKIETIAPSVPVTPIAPATNIVYVPSPVSSIDEKKLIEKITAIVRAKMDQDLKSKLETELTSLKASYEEKISSLKAEKTRADVDYTHLESLIRAAIYEYDSDKTGMFDFALESAGEI
ncbi:hypothetical protein OESDEN_24442 [Oesophagostomum dentatum]|uniref:Uncharacterized protein n=1 Tax=Oesophagostomum dentatum TaxID=61180 RepID=A0A0B1RTE4_OESDE|nr:hypothetical protein OESDEN_24442 [Oesophagostomum dentatum]